MLMFDYAARAVAQCRSILQIYADARAQQAGNASDAFF